VGNRGDTSRGHLPFLLLIGLAGWVATLALAAPLLPLAPVTALVLFGVVVAGARALAFPLADDHGHAEVSIDSAIFVAAAACLGAPLAAVGVATLLSVDSLVRAVRAARQPHGRSGPCRRRDPLCLAAHALYLGGLSGGLLAVLTRAFGFGGFHASGLAGDPWRVPLLGASFILLHYLVQTLQLRLAGQPWRTALKRNAIGALAEASLLPLALAIVIVFRADRLSPLALLGATYLLMNWGFHRLAHLARRARRRALELEVLNRVGHALSGSLETGELGAALVDETRKALPDASALYVVIAQGGEARVHLGGGRSAPAAAQARGFLKLRAISEQIDLDAQVRARVVVPLSSHGHAIGALVAESDDPEAFGADELRLLSAIAGQASTALENARLYALANVDGLTGLYCRRYFDQRIAEEVERSRRFSSTFALLLLDLDDFKQLNDTLGHPVGDRALREVAAIAASQLRGVDLAARYGGEELAFLLPRTSLSDAAAVAERIRDAVATHLFSENGAHHRITASLGVAGWNESGVDDPVSLVTRSDAALYRAKAAGKNRVEVDRVPFEIGPSLAPVRRRRA